MTNECASLMWISCWLRMKASQTPVLSVSLSQMEASCREVDAVCLCNTGPCTLYSEAHTLTPVSTPHGCLCCQLQVPPALHLFVLINGLSIFLIQ